MDFDVSQLRAVISIMINVIVAVSNLYALVNSSKINGTNRINLLKQDMKRRKEGRRKEKKKTEKRKGRKNRGDRERYQIY